MKCAPEIALMCGWRTYTLELTMKVLEQTEEEEEEVCVYFLIFFYFDPFFKRDPQDLKFSYFN